MADQPTPDRRGSPLDTGPGEAPGEGGTAAQPDRDFGDSAGYGSGGSTLDHRDVGASDTAGKHNPLDDVMGRARPAERSS